MIRLTSIVNVGVRDSMTRQKVRSVKLTNITIITIIILGILFLVPIVYENGWNSSANFDLATITILGGMLWLNHKGYVNLSRIIVSILPIFIIGLASIIEKLNEPENVVVFDFFDGRVVATGFFIVPFFLFSYREKLLLLSAVSIPILFVIGFDFIHTLAGAGFERFFGPMPIAYITSGIYFDIVILFASWSVYYFKANIESLLRKNYFLADDLGVKNVELSELLEEVEMSSEVLKKNKILIDQQKEQLEKANTELVNQVEQKTEELKQSNEELIRHNNELQQFSNTLSHNLRSPVANLLGLSALFKMDKSEENRTNVANHIFKSAETLDGVIKDLNKVIELRNNLFQIKEKIEIKHELDSIWQVLGSSVKQCNGKLVLDLNSSVIYGVRSYFHSIIYNLISNAIKYRHPERDCLIRVNTYSDNDNITIEVIDNGIGVDLEKHKEKIFGMYKRFHNHLEGKGLGLFLTKQQVEAMKGRITVESKLNIGSKFIINIPNISLSQIQSQLFFNSDVADIYLDAVNKITTWEWKKMPNPEEFNKVFSDNIDVFSAYDSVKWIVDLKLFVNFPKESKQWVLDQAIEQYVKVGIKHVVLVRSTVEQDHEFWNRFLEETKRNYLKVEFADSILEAKEILLKV